MQIGDDQWKSPTLEGSKNRETRSPFYPSILLSLRKCEKYLMARGLITLTIASKRLRKRGHARPEDADGGNMPYSQKTSREVRRLGGTDCSVR